jgi:DNA primase
MRGRYFDKDNNTKLPEGQSKYIGLGNDALNLNFTKRFFNSDILKKMLPGEHLLIVEGELDTIAGEVIGKNTIGIPGAQNIPDNEIFKKLLNYKITVCGDNDEAGGGMVDKIKDILLGLNKGFTIKRITYKDLNDLLAA